MLVAGQHRVQATLGSVHVPSKRVPAVLLMEEKRAGVKMTNHCNLMPELRTYGAIPPFLYMLIRNESCKKHLRVSRRLSVCCLSTAVVPKWAVPPPRGGGIT